MKKSIQNILNSNSYGIFNKHVNIPTWGLILAAFDALFTLFATNAAHTVVFSGDDMSWHYMFASALLCLLVVVNSFIYGVYRYWAATLSREVRAMLHAWVTSLAILALLSFLLNPAEAYSRSWVILTFVFIAIFSSLLRICSRIFIAKLEGQYWNRRNVVIIGAKEHSQRIATTAKENFWAGIHVSGFFDDSFENMSEVDKQNNPHILGSIADLSDFLEQRNSDGVNNGEHYINQVWVATDKPNHDVSNRLLSTLDKFSVDLLFVPDLALPSRPHQTLLHVAGIPMVSMTTSSLNTNQRILKAIEDYLGALCILTLISPLMLTLAIGVKLSSPGPIFYRQKRVTIDGNQFDILKFRSMPVDVEQQTGAVWSRKGENRATRFGTFLRRTSLDELPQFINVLKGEMSIVGPRPERPEFVEKFRHEIPSYMRKHLLKAGITGWAQINGYRGDTDLKKRIEYDLYYIDNWSLIFDIRIMLQTAYKGFVHVSAH